MDGSSVDGGGDAVIDAGDGESLEDTIAEISPTDSADEDGRGIACNGGDPIEAARCALVGAWSPAAECSPLLVFRADGTFSTDGPGAGTRGRYEIVGGCLEFPDGQFPCTAYVIHFDPSCTILTTQSCHTPGLSQQYRSCPNVDP